MQDRMIHRYRLSELTLPMMMATLLAFVFGEPLLGQTQVRRYDATKETGYGVVYTLPKSLLRVSLYVEEERYLPGELVRFAEQHLGEPAELQETHTYRLLRTEIESQGVIDTTARYIVLFDKRTIAPFVRLAEGGLIESINGRGEVEQKPLPPATTPWSKIDKAKPAIGQEYYEAAAVAEQAKLARAYYHRIKESMVDLAMGDMDNAPRDGEYLRVALSKLAEEERRVRRLFLGDTLRRVVRHDYYIEPTEEDIIAHPLARFSPYYGIVDRQDLSGDELLIDLRITERAPQLDEREARKHAKSLEGAIVYNMPGQAEATLRLEQEVLLTTKLPITQVGRRQALAKRMFDTKEQPKVEVYFDLRDGSIRRIETLRESD